MFSYLSSSVWIPTGIATGIAYGTLRYIINDNQRHTSSVRQNTITYRSPLSSATLSHNVE